MKVLKIIVLLQFAATLLFAGGGEEPCVTPPPGMISWISLDNDGSALEGPNGVVTGASLVTGMVDGAMHFDDEFDRVDLGNDAIFRQEFESLSIDAWVYPTAIRANGTVVSKTQEDGWAMRISNGQLNFNLRLTTGNINLNVGAVPLNTYSFVAVTYDGSMVRGYIDGVEVGNIPASGTVRNEDNSTTHVFIGSEPEDDHVHTGIPQFNFLGDIDEVEIFDRALTTEEVLSIYNAGGAGKCKGECPDAGIFPIVEDFDNEILADPNWVLQGSAELNTDWLRLTDDIGGQAGNAYLNNAFSSLDYVLIDFEYATVDYNGANCTFGIGDGLAFYLTDGTASPSLGEPGAALGYSHGQSGNPDAGIDGGFIAIGLDEFGNFAGANAGPATCAQLGPDAVTIRGQETNDNFTAYRCISSSLLPGNADIDVPSRSEARRVRIILSPGGILNLFMDLNDGNGLQALFTDLNTGQTAPPTFKLGFSSSTGGACIAHEIDNLTVGKPADIDVSIESIDTVSICDGLVQYVITIANNGPNDAEGISLEAQLDGQFTDVSWECADCAETSGGGSSQISAGLDIQIGDTVVMVVSVEVSEADVDLTLSAYLDFGCTGLISSNVNNSMDAASTHIVDDGIDVELGADTIVCDDILLLDAAVDGATYEWQDGSGQAVLTAETSGTYWVEVSVGECTAIDTIEVDLRISPMVSIEGDETFCTSESTLLTAQLLDPTDDVMWNDASTDIELLVDTEGTYSVTASNYCGSASDSVFVAEIECDCSYLIPNAFSPNGDGLNDNYEIGLSGSVDGIHIEIFDRWGGKVFESFDLDFKWDGKFHGRTLPTDVYYFYVEIECSIDGELSLEKGNITLIR